jgi:GT2 family glycosyltransferase
MVLKNESENQLPFVSVIIPTLNRKDYLKNCLTSLYNMDYPMSQFEIVVVDNGCTDGTEELVQQDFPQARFIFEKKKGAAFARNAGSKYAKGLFMAYTDDDCVVDQNWLKSLISGFTSTKIGGVGGPVFHLHPDYVPEKLWCDRTRPINFGDKRQFVKVLVTGNLAIRREVFEKICFDESFIFHHNEDIDFVRSILELGYKLLYEPSAVVYHDIDRERSCMNYIFKTAFFGGVSIYLLERKHAKGILFPKFMRAFLGSVLRFFRERKVASFYWLVECSIALLSSILLN